MPKQKSHSGAKKRFRVTASGLFKRAKSGKSHLLTSKSRKRKRSLRKVVVIDETRQKEVQKLLPYK